MGTEWPRYFISRETSCVFGLASVFAQHLPSQHNTKQTVQRPKRHNKPKTKTFMKLLRDYQSAVTIHSLDPARSAAGLCAGFVLDVMPLSLCFDMLDLAGICPHVRASHSFLSQVLRVGASWENLLTTLSSFLLAFALLYFLLLHLSELFSTLPSSNYLLFISLIFIAVSCPCFCALFFFRVTLCFISITCVSASHTVCNKQKNACYAMLLLGGFGGGDAGELLASESFLLQNDDVIP